MVRKKYALEDVVTGLVFTPKENGHGLDMDLHGSLAGILTIAARSTKTKREKQELIQQVVSVAEGCDRYTEEVQDILVVFGAPVAGSSLNIVI